MVNDESTDDPSFAELMSGVKKISDDRVNVYRDRAKKSRLPGQNRPTAESHMDFANIGYRQQIDIKDSQFDAGIQKKLERKIRQGQLPIEDQIDLHGYTQNAAIAELTKFLQRAISAEFKLLVIVHGKGNRSGSEAVLRPLVRHWLARQSSVLGWCPAQPKHGGQGASYVYLRAQR
jgi:DNA-nicking Smr family endonuclease